MQRDDSGGVVVQGEYSWDMFICQDSFKSPKNETSWVAKSFDPEYYFE